jgi:hypothetical protein
VERNADSFWLDPSLTNPVGEKFGARGAGQQRSWRIRVVVKPRFDFVKRDLHSL